MLDEITALIRKYHNRDIQQYTDTFLAASLDKRLAVTSMDSAAYTLFLAYDRVEAEAFLRSLSIGYSEFFRDPLVFALLGQVILPGLILEHEKSGRTEIRIWSAGSAAGQEAWSIAILLDQLVAQSKQPFHYRIIATDVSETLLAEARQGEYTSADIKNLPLKYIESCFNRQGEKYRVVERIRSLVDFSNFDLLDEHSFCPPASIFGDFDLIFCCNLLFYYRPEFRAAILAKIHRCLAPKGYLATGETERTIVLENHGFRLVAPPAAIFNKR